MDLSNEVSKLFPNLGKVVTPVNQVKSQKPEVINDDDFAEDEQDPTMGKPAVKNAEEKKDLPAVDQPGGEKNEADQLKYFYDFEKFGSLQAKFLGAGPVIPFTAGAIPTWKMQELDGTEWLIPQWVVFNQEQGSFKGFANEKAEEFIYHISWYGMKNLPNGGKIHDMKILKKLPG